MFFIFFFFFNDTATTEIYTLSLHDALPICAGAVVDVAGIPEEIAPMEAINDCCEGLRSSAASRRGVLLGGASFAAWAYLPKFARAADGRDPPLVVVILRGALHWVVTGAPVGRCDYAGQQGYFALTSRRPK